MRELLAVGVGLAIGLWLARYKCDACGGAAAVERDEEPAPSLSGPAGPIAFREPAGGASCGGRF